MKRSSGARLCAVTVAGALSLALITGCSDDGSKKDDAKGTAGTAASAPASSAPAAKALAKAELEKLLLTQGEIKGYKVDSGDATLPKSKSVVKVDKAECAPLAYAMAALPPGETDAGASNTVAEDKAASPSASKDAVSSLEDAFDIATTFVGLSSYDGDGAQKAFKAVSDGVAACSGGFGITADGEKQKITKVTAGKASAAADEATAFTAVADMDGEGTAKFNVEVARKGGVVATFYAINFSAMSKGGESKVPAPVIQAQVAKLK
ncbi:hypothetical protein ACIRG4_20915 [Streptomyces sp. NPDC102395]|uniref:hypothetical protein n=1 Tax=Streptomyces sp. NPDC102395 TaxID=3366168 RepID=UPI0038120A02